MKTMQEKKTGMPSETGGKSVLVFILQKASVACSSLGPYIGFRIARTGEKMTKNQVVNATPGEAQSKKKINSLKVEKGCFRAMLSIYSSWRVLPDPNQTAEPLHRQVKGV